MPGKRAPENKRRSDILQAAFRVATRKRPAGLTSRDVAAEAGVSNGLIFFHFRNREGLLLALLDWLLEEVMALGPEARAPTDPAEHMIEEVCAAIARLPKERRRLELFFEFWFMANHNREVRRRIRAALGRYRRSYLPLAQAVVAADPARYQGALPESLASIVAGFVHGCALQVVVDPRGFRVHDYCEAVRALVLRTAPGLAAPRPLLINLVPRP